MLDFMRRKANSWLMIAVFAIIIFVFAINFGPWAGQSGGQKPYVATVNNKAISLKDFQFAFSNTMRFMQRIQPDYNFEKAQAENLQTMVLDRLINQELLAQLAANNGLSIPDEVLRKYIQTRLFGEHHPFNFEEYQRYVHGILGTTEQQFENQTRREMLADRMAQLISRSSFVTNDEVQEAFETEQKQQKNKNSDTLDQAKIKRRLVAARARRNVETYLQYLRNQAEITHNNEVIHNSAATQ